MRTYSWCGLSTERGWFISGNHNRLTHMKICLRQTIYDFPKRNSPLYGRVIFGAHVVWEQEIPFKNVSGPYFHMKLLITKFTYDILSPKVFSVLMFHCCIIKTFKRQQIMFKKLINVCYNTYICPFFELGSLVPASALSLTRVENWMTIDVRSCMCGWICLCNSPRCFTSYLV
jgi:hypothetical protein